MAVHLYRVAAGGVMQTVDVLSDHTHDEAARLEPRERVVRGIREDLRPYERLGPALPDARGIAAEHVHVSVDHGIEAFPEAARRAEIGQATGGRDARSGQREHGRVALEEAREHLRIGIGDHADTVAAA